MRIAELADRTGVPVTTLRYYEDIGLLTPAGRSANGYRSYGERDVERLLFVTRAKRLDLALDDVRELVAAWDGDDCDGVRRRMSGVVAKRLAQAQEKLAALAELSAQLQAAAARLGGPAQPGACDDGCACAAATTPAIACTLDASAVDGRLADWSAVLGRATAREAVPGGLALTFEPDPDLVAGLARLATAESGCCAFFAFTLAVGADGVRLVVRAPAEAMDLLTAVFGSAADDAAGAGDVAVSS